ncbi:alpha-L-fucosidase [Chryseolinea lacunae]|uniref:alpha-L-fucosidase n=1 Tax=Chryseolinea lacunae TaxID=2801331 RepID=A0ABS1KT63_9BACT|nr:alpha-L-fucosidase [Chryseolinea lacunae]MBL0742407.1 alpha-L-fucosidase [Chryseolinea lacunae]
MKQLFGIAAIVCITFFATPTFAQPASELQAWKDLKFSMFIHWGIYSELGGVWDGKPISRGLSEQIQAHAGIYSDTYAAVAKRFNPGKWNADSVVLLAKAAGMRSIVITSKHHDGFCMFQSAHTDFDVVDATPYKRDVLKELSDACRRHGVRFGIYFSLIDWHYPQASPISSHNSDYITPEHHEYNKKQVTELLTNYGTVSELWFDMGSQSFEQSKALRDLVHTLQPNCFVSSRIGNDMGDFTVMGDNQEPDYSIGVPWQSPASFFDETWGYRSWQQRGSETDKFNEKLTSLIRVASRGGNYLLNIGPKGDGAVVDFEKHVLLQMGAWLKTNGEAIYGVQPDPFRVPFAWGSITSRPDKLYLHVLTPPANGALVLPGLKGKIKSSYRLRDHIRVQTSENANGVTVKTPTGTTAFDVLVLEFKDNYAIAPAVVIKDVDGKIVLNTHNAFKYFSNSTIDYNTRYQSTVKESWMMGTSQKALYMQSLYYTNQEKGKTIDLLLNGKESTVALEGGEPVPLQVDLAGLVWAPTLVSEAQWSGLESSRKEIEHVVEGIASRGGVSKEDVVRFKKETEKPGEIILLPAEMLTAYYAVQEITSTKEQPLLVEITAGEGVVVFVNNEEQLIHLAPHKEERTTYTVLVHLKAGSNRIVVKLFNNFHKEIQFAIKASPQQIIYRKQLGPVEMKPGKFYDASWRLHNPETQHQTLLLPNLWLESARE